MPRNGSGTMSVSNTFSAATEIKSSPMNANFTDIASEITGSLPRDGQAAMTGQLKSANGTEGAPGITWGSDLDTGIYRPSAGTQAVVSEGVTVATFASTGLTLEEALPIGSGGTGAVLTDPGADRVLFWDDSAGAGAWLTVGTGLEISTTTLALSHLGIQSLADPNADRIMMWDDSAGGAQWLGLSGLTITDTTLAVDAATTSAAGIVETATKAEMQAETSGKYPDAAILKNHPGIAKFWAKVTVTAGTPAVSDSYNVTSVTDVDTGDLTLTIANDFADADWCCHVSVNRNISSSNVPLHIYSQAAGTVSVRLRSGADGNSAVDPSAWFISGFGALA